MAVVGRIARAHGIRGQVIVNAETDFPRERFRPGAELFAKRPGGADGIEALVVTAVRFQHDRPVIAIRGVDDMNTAIKLAGTELRVPIDQLMPLPDGAFYRHDLIGCAIETREGEQVGLVAGVEGTFTGSRLVVDTGRGELLVPLVDAICVEIDPAAKRIVIDPPQGLMELNLRPELGPAADTRGIASLHTGRANRKS
jgi:16S rRNA processing protein RimM